jgi:hypothetical protein
MPDPLHTPSREQVITTNAWAFLHWLRTARDIDLPDWSALQQFAAERPADFRAAIAAFARLPGEPLRLVRHSGPQEALVLRKSDGSRVAFTRDQLGHALADPEHQSKGLGPEIMTPIERSWPPALLIRPLAELLLHADIRPDDRLLVADGPTWPWLASLLEGTTVILAAPSADTLLTAAADEAATIVVAPARILADAAFQRARRRPDLARLRTIIASGGPLSPEGRTRIYTWIKPALMLLGRTGDTLWGNPLGPVLARPPATPGFLRPPPSDPTTP